MSRLTVYGACAVSLALGLFFVFVWAPHPWKWEGLDQYYDYGRILASGGAFPTIDYPWGYAYYLAPFYRVFGDRPVIPLVCQVALNALMPLHVYHFARKGFTERIAIVAAVLTGIGSFNTVYASTHASDAICTVLFMTAVLTFAIAMERPAAQWFAATGVTLGIALQFRPNLILLPFLLAAFLLMARRSVSAAFHGILIVACAAVMLAPWTIRNLRLTGEVIPTSTHGTMQLWYGTLQTGPYLKSRAYNPRRVFEDASFDYTSLDHVPLVVTWRASGCASRSVVARLIYWTDRDGTHRQIRGRETGATFVADLPPSPAPTAYYIQPGGDSQPFVYFVSSDHLGDMDRHGDVLDVFDVVRLMRHAAWNEDVPYSSRLDLD